LISAKRGLQEKATKKQLRQFGLLVGGVFAVIGMWPVAFRGEDPRLWSLVTAVLLIVPALVFPSGLRFVHRGWMFIGEILGWINTRIILGTIFYTVVTATGLIMRLSGKDPMNLRLDPQTDSYRRNREPRPISHMKHQF
jgi:Saxitoxin biosynthesis operon protein SxtJ